MPAFAIMKQQKVAITIKLCVHACDNVLVYNQLIWYVHFV